MMGGIHTRILRSWRARAERPRFRPAARARFTSAAPSSNARSASEERGGRGGRSGRIRE